MEVFPKVNYLLLQILPFAGVLLVLKFVLLDPLLKHLIEREQKTTGAMDTVRDLHSHTESVQLRYETRLAEIRAESSEIRAKLVAEASAQEAEVLNAARAKAEQALQRFRAELETEITASRQELEGRSEKLAVDVASAVLGRPLSSPASGEGA